MGFKDYNQYESFLIEEQILKSDIIKRFEFEKLSLQEKTSLKDSIILFIQTEYNLISSNTVKPFLANPGDGGGLISTDFLGRRSNCDIGALAVYTLELIGCGSAAAVGAGTLGFGGVAVYALCSGAALVHYGTMVNQCVYEYQDCVNPRN